MKFTIPIYVETRPQPKGGTEYVTRALFELPIFGAAESLERSVARLTKTLREKLRQLAREPRHDALSQLAFCPELTDHRLKLEIELRRQWVETRLLLVLFRALDRWVAFTPSVPDVWFEVPQPDALQSRAEAVLSEHFRRREKEDGDQFVSPAALSLPGSAWVTTLELSQSLPARRKKPERDLWALLGRREEMDGEEELFRVGRKLQDLYPDELDRVVLREREAEELARLLTAADRRPVLLLGPRQVGKTSLIHEYVFRDVERSKAQSAARRQLWLLSPQRLISGMCYVGQWESRLLAILKHAVKKDHVLYFDDMLGLYHAGVSMESSLSVAHVLKPYIERRDVRLLAEMTPEAFRVFRERDRGFADLFHLLRLETPSEPDVYRILISAQRQLEVQHQCRFAIDALPAVFELQRRYQRGSAFPGKACTALRRLAVKHQRATAPLTRRQVLEEFHAESGLPLSLVDDDLLLKPHEVREQLRRRFVGQPEALEAAVDVVCLAKSRLNDPDRPLSSLFLVGPTGVGKTQFAKEMARYFFGSPDKVLRFDMNEYVSAAATTQLVGNFAHPEGSLTAAIRRQPFAVVLFDEIEKAHRDVHDLLLQVLGEGRLTDAHGRTADFTNAIILLTSNVGTTHSAVGLGFGTTEQDAQHMVRRAVEQHFRPEFVNRLDRIIVFRRLPRDEMREIARVMLEDLLQRPGLRGQRSVLDVSAAALNWIIDQGYDPALGARAIRRTLEERLTSAVAEHLAAVATKEAVTLIRVGRTDAGLAVQAAALVPLPQGVNSVAAWSMRGIPATLTALKSVHDRFAMQVEALRPAGPITAGGLSPAQVRYFNVSEELQTFACELEALQAAHERLQHDSGGTPVLPIKSVRDRSKTHKRNRGGRLSPQDYAGELEADADIADFVRESDAAPILSEDGLRVRIVALAHTAAWIDALLRADNGGLDQTITLTFDGPAAPALREKLAGNLPARCGAACGWDVVQVEPGRTFRISGNLAAELLSQECGWHLLAATGGALTAVLVKPQGDEVSGATDGDIARLVREYHVKNDGDWVPTADALRRQLLGRLPVPSEFRQVQTY